MIKFIYSDRKQINSHPGPEPVGGGGQLTWKGQEGTSEVKKNVLYLDCGGGYVDVCTYQNTLNCTLEVGAFYFV